MISRRKLHYTATSRYVYRFNPEFNETFTFRLHFPAFALLRFCVKDFDKTSANDFVGEFTVPVSSVRPGMSLRDVMKYYVLSHTA